MIATIDHIVTALFAIGAILVLFGAACLLLVALWWLVRICIDAIFHRAQWRADAESDAEFLRRQEWL